MICPSTPLNALWFSFFKPLESFVQFIGDVGVDVIQEPIAAGDPWYEEGLGVGRGMICALQGFLFGSSKRALDLQNFCALLLEHVGASLKE